MVEQSRAQDNTSTKQTDESPVSPLTAARQDRERRYQEALAEHNPLVTGIWAKIVARTSDPKGFIISTKVVEGRREVDKYPAARVNQANARELRFQQGRENKRAATAKRKPEKVTLTGETFGKPKVVIRDYEVINTIDPQTGQPRDELALTIAGNSYTSYREFADVNEGTTGRKLGMILGVAMGLVTADGYIIFQKRGKNATYGDDTDEDPRRGIPGSSAAGTVNAKLALREAIRERAQETGNKVRETGILIEPIDTDYLIKSMCEELEEEDGVISTEVIIVPTALAKNGTNPNYEACMTGVTQLTAVEFLKRAAKNQAVKRGRYDFAERVEAVTPKELEDLFAADIPWPGTHALTMQETLKLAYIQKGISAEDAEQRILQVRESWFAANRRINATVRRHYDEHPEALEANRQIIPNLSDLGYDARIYASKQGIRPLGVVMEEKGIGETTKRLLREAGLAS